MPIFIKSKKCYNLIKKHVDKEIQDYMFFKPKTRKELDVAINYYKLCMRHNSYDSNLGQINYWNTVLITDMSKLFSSIKDFN